MSKVVVLRNKPITFLTSSLPPPLSLRKLPIKLKSRVKIGFVAVVVVVFISKSPNGNAIYRRNERVLPL